jgi:hypothetical protein
MFGGCHQPQVLGLGKKIVLGQNIFVLGQNIFVLGQNIFVLGQNIFVLGQNIFVLGQKNGFWSKHSVPR